VTRFAVFLLLRLDRGMLCKIQPPFIKGEATAMSRWSCCSPATWRRSSSISLHLDGSPNRLPKRGADLTTGDGPAGFVGTSARHHELGPIALGMVKRNVSLDDELVAEGRLPESGGQSPEVGCTCVRTSG
jgi:hypothetical protein